jgi:hypothetical protein
LRARFSLKAEEVLDSRNSEWILCSSAAVADNFGFFAAEEDMVSDSFKMLVLSI